VQAVSEENLEIVRQAFASAAPLSAADLLAPDAEFDFTALYPDRPVLRGVEEMRVFRDTGPWGKSIRFAPERYLEVDDERVLVLVRATASGQQSGAPVVTKVAHEFTLRQGRIVRIKLYLDWAEALKAVALDE
jgi:ketosteroid isomerase-like protein